MQFTGIIKQSFPITSGTNKETGKEWSRQQFLVEEPSGAEYKDTLFVTCFREPITTWMAANVGKLVTLFLDARVRNYDNRYYQEMVVWGCTYNGTRIGVEQQPQQPTQDQQVYYAKGQPQQSGNVDALPF